MNKLLLILLTVIAISCGGNGAADREAGAETEDYNEESAGLDEASGENISPQLELDSTESRFRIDTISSSRGAEKQSEDDSLHKN